MGVDLVAGDDELDHEEAGLRLGEAMMMAKGVHGVV